MIGRAYYEIGDIDRAAGLIEEARAREPNHAEAHYYLGLVRDERGDFEGCHRRVPALPPARPRISRRPRGRLPRELFAKAVDKALAASLDPILSRYVRDAGAYVEPTCPGMELVADGVDPRALVLIDGVGTPEGPPRPPTRIFVYQRNIERLAGGNRSTRARDHLGVRARDHRHLPGRRLRRKKTSASSISLLGLPKRNELTLGS